MKIRKTIFVVYFGVVIVATGAYGQPVMVRDQQLIEAYQGLEKVFLIHYVGLPGGEENLEKYFGTADSILKHIFTKNAVITFSSPCRFRRNYIDNKRSSYRVELSLDIEKNSSPILYYFYASNKEILNTLSKDDFKNMIIKVIADEQGHTFTISKTAGTWAGIKVNCEIIEMIP